MDVGFGMNTKSELLALWGLLFFAIHKKFLALQVRGDSKAIIDWALNKHEIHSVELEHWLSRVKDLFRQFSYLSFQHVYSEYNALADDLSKRAISLGIGAIHWEEYSENSMIDSGSLQLH